MKCPNCGQWNKASLPHCMRCGAPLNVRTMSMYKEDVICMECKEKEQQRPDYREAVEAEMAEIRRGNFNF